MTSTQPSVLTLSPVVPVVQLDDVEHAVPLARALHAGGLRVIEVTLRTDTALPAIERIAAEVPEITIGAGTITTPGQVPVAVGVGAQFLVSPGSTPLLLDALSGAGVPFLPGVSTVSEMLALLERGITDMKFFPAAAAGGHAYLKAIAGPVPQARFCPTGGITPLTAELYLSLPNVACVGGSWLAPAEALATGDWTCVKQLATQAIGLGTDASRPTTG